MRDTTMELQDLFFVDAESPSAADAGEDAVNEDTAA